MTMMGNGWGMGAAGLGSLLLLAAVIAGAVLLVRFVVSGSRRDAGRPDPADVLAERFARGEIDEQEYRRRLQVLDEPDDRHITRRGEPT